MADMRIIDAATVEAAGGQYIVVDSVNGVGKIELVPLLEAFGASSLDELSLAVEGESAMELAVMKTVDGVESEVARVALRPATQSANGIMSAQDKEKLDGIATGATKDAASDAAPLMDGEASAGESDSYSRADHVHPSDEAKVDVSDFDAALDSKADKRGAADRLLAGASRTVLGEASEGTFLSRVCPARADGLAEISEVRGNTVVWNQLVGNGDSSVTVANGHKYLARIGGTASIATSNGTAIAVTGGTDEVFDLTLMYGAGNEPQTVAEFEAVWGTDYKPYSAPRLLDTHISGINGLAFPEQTLRGIGTNQDVMTSEGIERVIGVHDFTADDVIGAALNASGHMRVRMRVPTPAPIATATGKCAEFELFPQAWNYGSPGTFAISSSAVTFIFDETVITNQDEAKAWFTANGPITAEYELATPTTEQFDSPIDLTYQVQQDGTESWIVPEGDMPTSAVPTALIAYPEDVADVRDDALSAIAPVENGLASANYAVGDYLVRGGRLYRVTTAIAAGESIPSSSISATTVAALIKALQ